MFRELIAQCIAEAGVEYAHLEPPCPEEEIAQAEAAVGYPFPEELKALLRETDGDHWLLWSAREIMENAKLLPGFLDGCDTFEEYLEKVARHIFFAGTVAGTITATASCLTDRWTALKSTFGNTRSLSIMLWPGTSRI